MKKTVFFAAAALIAGASLAAPVQASDCGEMAKAKASNIKERIMMKRECKKSMKGEKKEGRLSKLNFLKDRS